MKQNVSKQTVSNETLFASSKRNKIMRINGNKEIVFENNRTWLKKELNKPRARRLIKAYANMLINGSVDFKVLGNIYRQDEKIPGATVKRLFRYQEIKDMIDKELEKALIGNGITKDFLINARKEIIQLSKDKEKYDIMLKGVEGFEDMYNMKQQNKEIKTLTQTVNYKEMLENGSKSELSLSQSESEPINEDENNIQKSE